MLQGIIALGMAGSLVWFGARAVSDPEEAWRRRAQGRGNSTASLPTAGQIRRIKSVGAAIIVMGVVFGLVALVLTIKMAALESEIRDLDEERDRLGAPAEDVRSTPGVSYVDGFVADESMAPAAS